MGAHTKTVTAICGLWRGLRQGETGVVPDDGTTAYGIAHGLCEEAKPARSRQSKAAATEANEDGQEGT